MFWGMIFVLGLVFGSFLNSLLYRIDNKASLSGRSFCPKCKNQIAWHDNVPLLSYLLLRGKCRHCKKGISLEYPAVELLVAAVFVLVGAFTNPGQAVGKWLNMIFDPQSLIYGESTASFAQFPIMALLSLALLLLSCFLLLAVAIYDAKTKNVLSYYAYAAAILAFFYQVAEYLRADDQMLSAASVEHFSPIFLAALLPAGLFWVAAKLSKEKMMGLGDADIALAIGFLLGWPQIVPSYYFAFLVGAFWGIALLALRKAKLKSEIPFGPFLIAGAVFSLFFGEQIITWYGRMFLGA